MPAAAKRHTPAGAEAFTRFYFAALNYAQGTLDTEVLARLRTGACDGCQGVVDNIDSVRKRHGTVHGGEETIHHVVVSRLRAGDLRPFEVVVKCTATKQAVRFPNGRSEHATAARTTFRLVLYPTGDSWQVGTLAVV